MSSFQLTGIPAAAGLTAFATETSPSWAPGSVQFDTNGDKYRYVMAISAVSAGHLVQAPTPLTTAAKSVAVNTAAVGDTSVTITAGAQAIAANAYAGGTLVVVTGTAIGDAYPIVGNTAITAAGGSVTVLLGSPIRSAFGASDTVTLAHEPANGVQEVASSTLQPVGIALSDIAAASFGWVKCWGVIGALADENLTLGALLTSGTSTSGTVEEYDDDSTPDTDNIVGFAVFSANDGETQPIFVTIG